MAERLQRGQALVEFALIAPVLLLALLGGGEVGFAMLHGLRLQNAAVTISERPDVLDAEVARLGLDCASSITEADGIRLVVLDCDNPLPLVSGVLAPTLHAEATAVVEETP
jgi:hypothetical protein